MRREAGCFREVAALQRPSQTVSTLLTSCPLHPQCQMPSPLTPHSSLFTHTPAHLKHLQQLLLAHLQPHKRLFLFDNAPEECVELVKVRGGDLPSLQECVVVVPILNWRSIAEDTSARCDGGGSNCVHVIIRKCKYTDRHTHTHTHTHRDTHTHTP